MYEMCLMSACGESKRKGFHKRRLKGDCSRMQGKMYEERERRSEKF